MKERSGEAPEDPREVLFDKPTTCLRQWFLETPALGKVSGRPLAGRPLEL